MIHDFLCWQIYKSNNKTIIDDTFETDLVKIVNNSNQVNKNIEKEEFATEQSKNSERTKLIEPNESGALVVTKQTKTTTNSFSSEITAKTEEQQAKTTGSKANVIVVSRGAKEGLQAFIQTQKYKQRFTH